jgi:signal transduction histidine kinase/ActR/RegA family two-component response regulator
MSDALHELAAQYTAAFQEYLSGADEAALQRAYELGHDAMIRGLRMLDLAAMHHEVLAPVLLSAGTPEEQTRTAAAAAIFFMESLSPFEMTHRGFLEANATLRRLNQTLEQQVREVQTAHAAAEAAEWRSRFLAEASMQLDAALDYSSRLAIAAQLAVPDLADYCLLDAVEENGEVCRVEATAADPAQQALIRGLPRPPPLDRVEHPPRSNDGSCGGTLPDSNAPAGVSTVLRTGRSELWPELSEALLATLAPDDAQFQWLRQLGLRSAMIVPLPARGRTLAVMTFLAAESSRTYGPEELALAEDFARRAAITFDNARLYREVREAAQRKDEFLMMLAHELRNPLASVVNALHLLRRRDDPGTRERARGVMERQVHHLTHLIDDLLDVSRITRGKILLHYERLDLATLVRDCTEDHRPALDAASLTLVTGLPEGPVWVNGDPTRFAQVLDNLLANAIKFTEPGGQVSVCLETDAAHHWAIVTVRDTGIGIEPETLPQIFDSFAQADRTLDRTRGGLGLGLSIVKGLVELHGGEVTARSEGLGRGAEFTVCFPWEPVAPQAAVAARPGAAGGGSRRILIVEDNQDAAESLKSVLELEGHEVHLAFTGPAGVAAARQLQPEVVLCDLGLPGMDGFAVAAALRQEPATAATRLIAVTGYGQEEDRHHCQEAGFDEHLVKPVDFEQLERLLGGTEARPRGYTP